MEDKLIDYELAVLAKRKGFDIPVHAYYQYHSGTIYERITDHFVMYSILPDNAKDDIECFLRPTQSLLQKWLRDKHKIDVEVHVYTRPHYCVDIINQYSGVEYVNNPNLIVLFEEHPRAFITYEEALEEGLKQAIAKIKT